MRDLPQIVPPRVSAGALKRFMTATGLTDARCDCGESEWSVQVTGEDVSDNGPAYEGTIPDVSLRNYVAVYLTHCANCGTTRLINSAVVKSWLLTHG